MTPDRSQFLNPYTFVPAFDRAGDSMPEPLRDGPGPTHDRLHDDQPRWTGRIGVCLTVHTPLLLLDTAAATTTGVAGHLSYPARTRQGRPDLPPTAVKGMLRAAYEAITNSRFGVFDSDTRPVGYRPPVADSQGCVPVRLEQRGNQLVAVLLYGSPNPDGQAEPDDRAAPRNRDSNPIQSAAWLPAYCRDRRHQPEPGRRGACTDPTCHIVRYPDDGGVPEHGDEVVARLELMQHYHRKGNSGQPDFRYWRVRSMVRAKDSHTPPPVTPSQVNASQGLSSHRTYSLPVAGTALKTVRGWVHITNRNSANKHDERVFFADPEHAAEPTNTVVARRIDDGCRQRWKRLIASYRDAHREQDIHVRRAGAQPQDWISNAPGETAWSPHLYDDARTALQHGLLCYAQLDQRTGQIDLVPVQSSRQVYAVTARDLLPRSLHPASTIDELSPADRLFGWVAPQAGATPPAAYRGRLRVGPIDCLEDADTAIRSFAPPGLALSILGQPKPQQGRFYLADSSTAPNTPLSSKWEKNDWYVERRGLRGRKVYWHHAGTTDAADNTYWEPELRGDTDPTQKWVTNKPDTTNGKSKVTLRHREYLATRESTGDKSPLVDNNRAFSTTGQQQRTNQNRSITGWVTPDTHFRFTLDVRDLDQYELGALIWLLSLPDNHFHRLGLGKPLGFGSVRLDIEHGTSQLWSTDQWRRHYRSLCARRPAPDTRTIIVDAERAFRELAGLPTAEPTVAGEPVDTSPQPTGEPSPVGAAIDAFLAAARGHAHLPVHYPRIRPDDMDKGSPVPPNPAGQAYEWFSENECQKNRQIKGGVPLPAATAPDPALRTTAPEGQ